jgi:thiosulfate/3-mercaptopyruvate sulfurtransferase
MSPSHADDAATVDADWIATHIDDPHVRLVEVDVSPGAYNEGHIPGGVLWNAYTDLRDQNYRPVGLEELQRLLSRSGISSDTCVVTYGYAAPLGFWLLKAHGHDDARTLMGARDQWARAGHKWSTDVPEPPDGDHPPLTEQPQLLASREAVEAAIGDPSAILLDVRAESEYGGGRFWPSGATEDAGRAGRVPGSVNVPIDSLRTADGSLKSPEELGRVLEDAGIARDKAVIAYCTIGNRASEAWFALKYLLGYPNTRVYYGSWVEWGRAADTRIET